MEKIYLDKSLVIAGPDTATDGDLAERRCVRVEDDKSQRSQCPGGGQEILASILKSLSFEVPTTSYDSTYRTIIRSQDDGQGYGLSISNGTLTTERLEEEFNEKIEVSPSDFSSSDRTEFPVQIDLAGKIKWVPNTIISATLSGSILDANGESAVKPLTQLSGTILYFQYSIFADINITYKATTDASLVEIDPAGDAENNYQSQLIISSECEGLSRFNVDVPECFDSAYKLLEEALEDEETKVEEEIKGADLLVDKDICTGEVEERIIPK